MGLFDFLRRKDRSAMPDPGSREFQAAVEGSALPGSASMGEEGWSSVADADSAEEVARRAAARFGVDPPRVQVEESKNWQIDLGGTDAREKVIEALRQHGIDPDKGDQTIDASSAPGLREALMAILGEAGMQIPEAGGFGGRVGASGQVADPRAQVEHLAKQRDAGRITEAEFLALKKRLLGE
jgi:hypothetical protein